MCATLVDGKKCLHLDMEKLRRHLNLHLTMFVFRQGFIKGFVNYRVSCRDGGVGCTIAHSIFDSFQSHLIDLKAGFFEVRILLKEYFCYHPFV